MDKGHEVAPNKRGIFLGETGAKITIATTSEQELGRVPVIQDALDHGIRRCLSGDVEVCLARDVHSDAGECHDPANGWRGRKSLGDANAPVQISHPDVLEFTTPRAEAAGRGDQVDSLIPGHTPTSSLSARRPQ